MQQNPEDARRADKFGLFSKENETANEEDYDPHLHREVDHTTNNIETFAHLVKACIGTGLLAMPYAFKNSGLVLGTVGMVFIGSACIYGIHVLLRCQYILCKQTKVPLLTYTDTVTLALKQGPKCFKWLLPFAGTSVDILLVFYQLGICSVYIVFVAKSIKEITDYYWIQLDMRLWLLTILIPIILLLLIKDLKMLAPFSEVANALIITGIAIILYYALSNFPSPSSVPYVGHLEDLPLYFGITLFAVEPIGVVGAIESHTKYPKSFIGYFGILNISAAFIISIYTAMGFVGYVKYASEVKESISLNIPRGEILSDIVVATFGGAILLSYALQCYVPIEIIWNEYLKKRTNPVHYLRTEYIMRFTVVLLTFSFAAAIPKLGLFISLVGAVCLPMLGLGLPGIIELCVHWPEQNYGHLKYVLWRNIFFILFGLFSTIVATTVNVISIAKAMKNEKV